jgi:hypothetical protein
VGVLGDAACHGAAADGGAAAGREQRVAGASAALNHPDREHGGGLFPQGRGPLFASFAEAAEVAPTPSTTSLLRSPVSSETRRQVSTATSSRAWSPRPVQVFWSGAASRASTFGRVEVGQLGVLGAFGGSDGDSPGDESG